MVGGREMLCEGTGGVGSFFERERGRGKSTTYERHNIIFFIFFFITYFGIKLLERIRGSRPCSSAAPEFF